MIKLIEGIALKDLENLVWMDLEFTGLEDDHVIIELACLITDKHLNVIAEGPHLVIQRTEGELANIDDWPLKVHTKSGLLEKVKTSDISIQDADQQLVNFISEWTIEHKAILCGNSIHMDRKYIHKEMPLLDAFLHYRMIDVSSFKEVIKRWYKEYEYAPKKQNTHEALADIKESIKELQWYRDTFFKVF